MDFDAAAVRHFEHAGWQQAAGDYNATFAQASREFIEPLLDAVAVAPGMPLLDVCCGTGLVTEAALRRGAAARGVDFSAAMLGEARRSNPKIAFNEGDAEDLPYPDAAFAAVVANFGIHHVPRPQKAVAEMLRVLRPGGRMAFTAWASSTVNIAWRLLFDAIAMRGDRAAAKAPPSGGNLGSEAAVAGLLTEAGFAEVGVATLRRYWLLAAPCDLIQALARGTVRTAALIAAQPTEALPAIEEAVVAAAAPYRRDDGNFAVPIAAILGVGAKLRG
ncbi:MAG TPA: methyltransferase domain-containing protein [Stellaceae bacterium]|jgi:SAM-dependent methyltransferase|nr:methyltransferase domain-containing protein [Stellaceae bacterium]